MIAAALAVRLAGCGGAEPEARPPDVLLVTLDTLRADRLGAYGARGIETPYFDTLAAGGVLYERAVAPMGMTLPSHISLFTGLYPREHGVLNNGTVLAESIATLPELLRDAGYATAGFTSVRLLAPENGAAQGFDTFAHPEAAQRRAGATVPLALDWLARQPPERPIFLWVHLFDPHLPYEPPGEWLPAGGPDLPDSVDWNYLQRVAGRNGGEVPAEILARALELYDGEVAYADHWLGRLVRGMREAGRWDGTLAVVTADHGECFENGVYFEHSECLWQGTIRVPLVVRWPSGHEGTAGVRVAEQVSLLDVAPTLLEAVGLPLPERLSGRPLTAAARRGYPILIQQPFYPERAGLRRARLFEAIASVAGDPTLDPDPEVRQVGLVTREWKLLRSPEGEALYRLPEEDANLLPRRPEAAAELTTLLDRALARHPLNLAAPETVDPELVESLKALGYVR